MVRKKDQKNISNYKILKYSWVFVALIAVSLSFSLVSLAINFKLINIEKFTLFHKEEQHNTQILDNSTTINSNSDVMVKNLINSTVTVQYNKINQMATSTFTQSLGIRNNDKWNLHNVVLRDSLGNTVFIKDFPFNKSIMYADCNAELTNCMVYSSFKLENNMGLNPCFERIVSVDYGDYQMGPMVILPYFYQNPSACVS